VTEPELVWMFAYGANMNDSILIDRRQIPVVRSVPAILDGYRLCFDQPGLPWIEPVFANIEPAPGDCVHGVLRQLHCCDLARLDAMEGGDTAYERIHLEARTYDGHSVPTLAYRALQRRKGERPSARYLGVLCKGATEHNLDPVYIDALHAITTATPVPHAHLVIHYIEVLMRRGLPVVSIARQLRQLIDWGRDAIPWTPNTPAR